MAKKKQQPKFAVRISVPEEGEEVPREEEPAARVGLIGEEHLGNFIPNMEFILKLIISGAATYESKAKEIVKAQKQLRVISAFVEKELKTVLEEDPEVLLLELPDSEAKREAAEEFNAGRMDAVSFVKDVLYYTVLYQIEDLLAKTEAALPGISKKQGQKAAKHLEQLAVNMRDAVDIQNEALVAMVKDRQVRFIDIPDRDERVGEIFMNIDTDKDIVAAIDEMSEEREAFMVKRVQELTDEFVVMTLICGDDHIPGISAKLDEAGVGYEVLAQIGAAQAEKKAKKNATKKAAPAPPGEEKPEKAAKGTGKVWLVGEQHLIHIVSNIRDFFTTMLPLFPSLEEAEREKSLSEYEAMLLRTSGFVEEELKAATAEDPKIVLIEIPNTESERAFADAFNNGKISAEELIQKAVMLTGPITELREEIWNRFNSFLENFASNNDIDIAELKQDPWVQRIEQLAVGVDDAIEMFNGAYAEIVNGRQVGFADMPDRDERVAELMRTQKIDEKQAVLAIDDERNTYMAERVAEMAESFGSALLICGAAHIAGISADLDEAGIEWKLLAQFGIEQA
jgi:hypothetical protein